MQRGSQLPHPWPIKRRIPKKEASRKLMKGKSEMMCRRTMEKLQKEYEADAIQLKKIVQKEEPEFWKINGKNWNEIYRLGDSDKCQCKQ